MATTHPALFLSHGAPSLLLDPVPARGFLASLGATLARPRAVLCISAHWTTAAPRVTGHPQPPLLYDFGGFSDELYRVTYPAPGAPELAREVASLLGDAGVAAAADPDRGLDHGAWVPLKLLFPAADIPVLQLSVQPHLPPEHHLALGRALAPLRQDGVLVMASGAATHNLHDLAGRGLHDPPPAYVRQFADWLAAAVGHDDRPALLDWRRRGPSAAANHPTPEHLLPLFVALGAGGPGRVLHRSHSWGILAMDAFAWG